MRRLTGMQTFCVTEGCDLPTVGRELCRKHYDLHKKAGTLDRFGTIDDWVNPLVCDCAVPDPDSCCGMCRTCKRKPLALMAPKVAS